MCVCVFVCVCVCVCVFLPCGTACLSCTSLSRRFHGDGEGHKELLLTPVTMTKCGAKTTGCEMELSFKVCVCVCDAVKVLL